MSYWSAVSLVSLSSLALVCACVIFHYEALSTCHRYLLVLGQRRRPRALILIGVVLIAHIAEIWLFGAGYYLLRGDDALGTLRGLEKTGLADFVYFSAMTYTTVGFGDVVPSGPIRLLAGAEAITGLVMLAWSASYTFREMTRQ
jgi:hypothetical protein